MQTNFKFLPILVYVYSVRTTQKSDKIKLSLFHDKQAYSKEGISGIKGLWVYCSEF